MTPDLLQPSRPLDAPAGLSPAPGSHLSLLVGDCRETLKTLPDESVQCCVTSPPYYGLRDYGRAGQMGLEETPDAYVAAMVALFAEVRRVLKHDGTLWLNLGDSYWTAKGAAMGIDPKQPDARRGFVRPQDKPAPAGLKAKDLIGIPWRVAFAMQADGWWLRGDQIWAKPNGMPESVEDRPTRSHEYVFMLTKAERYYYDAAAVRLPAVPESVGRLERAMRANLDSGSFVISGGGYAPPGQPPHQTERRRSSDKQRGHTRRHAGFNDRWDEMERTEQQQQGAALRSVWWLAPANSGDAHFAVMPESLAATCILASTKAGDTVIDPFGGSGTTGKVAIELGRRAVLIELNDEYAKIIDQRTRTTLGLPLAG